MRDVEKTQTKPTAAMMQSLFEVYDAQNDVVEKKQVRFREKQNSTNTL